MDLEKEMPQILKKMPLIIKLLVGGLPIIAGIVYSYYSTSGVIKNKKEFYEKEFSTVVIESTISAGRATKFHLENKLDIYFGLSVDNTIAIGDSIQKTSHTYIYNVYRRNGKGQYEFFDKYDFSKVY